MIANNINKWIPLKTADRFKENIDEIVCQQLRIKRKYIMDEDFHEFPKSFIIPRTSVETQKKK